MSSHSERLEIRRFNGSHKTIVVSAAPLSGLDARRVGAVVLLQDITEAHKIEQDLARRVTSLGSIGVQLEESATP